MFFNKLHIVLITLLLLVFTPLFSQTEDGSLLISNYDQRDYYAPKNQTWSITQNQLGVMYFGNNEGLLEFDGNHWQLKETTNKSVVRSVYYDIIKNRIYVGLNDDFGFFEINRNGILSYNSLIPLLNELYKDFGGIRNIVEVNGKIIFRSGAYIFIYENNTIKTLIPKNRFHTSFSVNNKFYVREWDEGLMILDGDTLKLINQGEIFSDKRIYVMLPYEKNSVLIITRNKGIYILSNDNKSELTIEKLPKFQIIENVLKESQVYCGVKIKKDIFVIGTLQNGIYIFNKQGELLKHLNSKSGLKSNDVLSLYVDKHHNIWAGLNNGISYIIYNSPFTYYNENNGLTGTVYSSISHKNQLYAGSSIGLFKKSRSGSFELVKDSEGYCWDLFGVGSHLYLGHFDGVFTIENSIAVNIVPEERTVFKMQELEGSNYILAGLETGLLILEKFKNKVIIKNKVKGFNELSKFFQVDDKNNIWVSHQNRGIFKLQLNQKADSFENIEFYNSSNGLPSNTNNYPFKINHYNQKEEVVFGTENGIYCYNKGIDRFIKDNRFKKINIKDGAIDKFSEDNYGNIYYQQGDKKGILKLFKDGTYSSNKKPFSKLDGLYVEDISIIDSLNVAFSTSEGLVIYNPEISRKNISFKTIIKQIIVNDSDVYNILQKKQDKITLPFKMNNISFSFSALFYEDHNKNQYSYMLKGFDKNWSTWSTKNEKEYTNLNHGDYIFKVKAKNIYEDESNIAEYHFEILPPWYRTIYAYIGYIFIFFILGKIIFDRYTKKLNKEKDYLEKVVSERTHDLTETNIKLKENQVELEIKQEKIASQKDEIEAQNTELEKHRLYLEQLVEERTADLNIAKEKAEESDRIKSAFFANMSHEIRTPMNAIIGFAGLLEKHGLESDKRNELSKYIISNSYNLLNLIEDIIDISKLESNQFYITNEKFHINDLMNAMREDFKGSSALAEGVNLNFQINLETNPVLFSDYARVKYILKNLIDNAIKFTEKGTIDINYSIIKDEEIYFSVEDTGIGMSEDQVNRIFNRFTKLEGEREKLYRGAGLGLYICKSILGLLGGEFQVESKVNKGTKFSFTLPYNPYIQKGN